MTYMLTLGGISLHRYGEHVFGWGPISSITGQPGLPVEWKTCAEAERWMQARPVFCSGAVVIARAQS